MTFCIYIYICVCVSVNVYVYVYVCEDGMRLVSWEMKRHAERREGGDLPLSLKKA